MGFWKKLFGIGAAAGGTAAAVKVAQKVKENNPDGVGVVNEDGVVDYKDYVEVTKKAAGEVYEEVAEKAKEVGAETVEMAKTKGDELRDKIQSAMAKTEGAATETAEQMADAATEAAEQAAEV